MQLQRAAPAWQVEAELRRIPRELSHGVEQHLWSIVYMPQASVCAHSEALDPSCVRCCRVETARVATTSTELLDQSA